MGSETVANFLDFFASETATDNISLQTKLSSVYHYLISVSNSNLTLSFNSTLYKY